MLVNECYCFAQATEGLSEVPIARTTISYNYKQLYQILLLIACNILDWLWMMCLRTTMRNQLKINIQLNNSKVGW